MPTTPNSRYFNEDELSAIVNGQVSPQMPTDLGEPTDPAAEPSKPIWDTYDTIKAVPRGAIDAAKGVYNLADWATMDLLPDWHTNPLGTSTSWSGSIVSGISQVATGFLAAGGVLGAASKIPGAVGATAGWLGGAGGGTAAAIRGTFVKGAVTDFAAFEGNAGRLSDLLVQADNPALNNAFTQFMATDMNDSELEGRLKNALEGGIIGGAFEGVIAGIKGSMKAVKEMKRLRAAGKSEEEAVQGAMQVAGKDLQDSADAASRAEDDAMTAQPEVAPVGDAVAAKVAPKPSLIDALTDSADDVPPGSAVDDMAADAAPKKPSTSDPLYPVKRGAEAMMDRINREAGQGGSITQEEATMMTSLVRRMGVDNFETMGIRFRKLGPNQNGSFSFTQDVINIARRATTTGDAKRTFVHEVWHSLTGYLDDSMLSSMKRDYEKAHVAFFDKHGISPREATVDGAVSKTFKKAVLDKKIPVSEWYRLINMDEWVAETMTDATFSRLALEADTKSVLGFLRFFTKNTLTEVKAVFGGAKYDKLTKDWLNGRYALAKDSEFYFGAGRRAEQRMYGQSAAGTTAFAPPSVDGMRTVVNDPPSIKELHDLHTSGADVAALAARIDELEKKGLINLKPLLGKIPGRSGVPPTPNMLEEAIIALRQYEANPDKFAKGTPATNEINRMTGIASVKAAVETGAINAAEGIQLMQRGLVTSKQLVDMMPFLEGLTAASRYNALQAIRAPGADSDAALRAFTEIFRASEGIKSNIGKSLQMSQAFSDTETIGKQFLALTPAEQRVRMEMMGDTLQLLLLDPKTGRRAAQLLTEGSYRSGMRVTVEMFRNSILSGPKTLAVNAWNGLQMLAMPLERAAGKALSGDAAGAANELSVLTRYWSQTTDAYQAMKISLSEEGDSFVLGRGNQQYGDEFVPGRRIGSKGVTWLNKVDDVTGAVQRTPAGAAMDFFGQVVNAPMRVLGASDEVAMTIVARSEADTVIRADIAPRMGKPLTDAAVSAEVARLRDLLFIDGQMYTRKTVEERGFRQARDKYLPGAFRETLGTVVADRLGKPVTDPAVVTEVSRLYNASMKAGKVDREAIKAIPNEAERKSVLSALDASGARAKAHPLFIPEVQRYIDQNWDATVDSDLAPFGGNMQQAAGEDYRILQRVSGEIERRVKEQTWKRDYTDIADEAAPFGSRLVGNIGKAFSTAVGHVPELQLIVPFIKTPTNLLAFVTDRNPIGQGLAWVQAAKAGDQKAVAQAAGRLATGTVLYTTGIGLAASGMITGKGPVDPDIRKQLLASGWQPYAIKVGGVYVSFGRNDPVATFLGIVADTVDISRSTYDPTPEDNGIIMGISKAAMMSIANNVTSKSYLRGLTTAMSAAMGDEAAANKMMRQFAGAVVPNALAQTEAVFTDSTIYETRNAVDAILARLPLTGVSVDKTRNALGEPLQGAESPWSFLLPVIGTRATKDPVNRALSDSLISVGGARRTLPGNIDLKQIKLKNGQSAYDRYGELTGQVKIGGKTVRDQLRSVISSPFFKGLPEMGTDGITSPRTSLIRGQVSDYRRAALEKLIKESPELAQAMAHARDVKANLYRGN
jgi:hypothetical protein